MEWNIYSPDLSSLSFLPRSGLVVWGDGFVSLTSSRKLASSPSSGENSSTFRTGEPGETALCRSEIENNVEMIQC